MRKRNRDTLNTSTQKSRRQQNSGHRSERNHRLKREPTPGTTHSSAATNRPQNAHRSGQKRIQGARPGQLGPEVARRQIRTCHLEDQQETHQEGPEKIPLHDTPEMLGTHTSPNGENRIEGLSIQDQRGVIADVPVRIQETNGHAYTAGMSGVHAAEGGDVSKCR